MCVCVWFLLWFMCAGFVLSMLMEKMHIYDSTTLEVLLVCRTVNIAQGNRL